ncbi:hypothetical protein HHK36_011324 [Tetracentron sinense]|uniref:RRM domain-containing protein n=1 Tax=Tetracentron sinense TaxID=13715 RepID=A0A834Z7X9_TETSI|nr:hypothetical protein HHK36_011324 [Tetracentron sinense]
MVAKAKKAMMKKLKEGSSKLSISNRKNEVADFLPLEGGPARKLPDPEEPVENTATVLYIGRIPHGFYEDEMEGFFKQFGIIKRLRIARNKKTGKSKHFGFIKFESPQVTKIVADCMHNYLLFEHMLQVHLIPPEHVHPKFPDSGPGIAAALMVGGVARSTGEDDAKNITSRESKAGEITKEDDVAVAGEDLLQPEPRWSRWHGVNRRYKPLNWTHIEQKQHNKERTVEEYKKLVKGILERDQKRKKRIEAAGIDFECPQIIGSIQPTPKKIRFDEE